MPESGDSGRDFSGSAFVVGRKLCRAWERRKIAAVGILVSVLSQILKHSGRDEQAFLVSLAGLLVVLFWIVPYIYDLFESIQTLFVM